MVNQPWGCHIFEEIRIATLRFRILMSLLLLVTKRRYTWQSSFFNHVNFLQWGLLCFHKFRCKSVAVSLDKTVSPHKEKRLSNLCMLSFSNSFSWQGLVPSITMICHRSSGELDGVSWRFPLSLRAGHCCKSHVICFGVRGDSKDSLSDAGKVARKGKQTWFQVVSQGTTRWTMCS